MEATPGKGIVYDIALAGSDNTLAREEPGVLSQIFIGFLWHYIMRKCIWSNLEYVWNNPLWIIKRFLVLLVLVIDWVYLYSPYCFQNESIFLKFLCFPLEFIFLHIGVMVNCIGMIGLVVYIVAMIILYMAYGIISLYFRVCEIGQQELERRRLEKK